MTRLYMETTKIPPERTVQEIGSLLAQAGARQIVTEFDAGGEIIGVRWTIERDGITIPFSMPARIEPVFQLLIQRLSPRNRDKKAEQVREQARRVAWRQLFRWLEAQLAMIETGMVATEEVFMPYIEVRPGRTMFEELVAGRFKALPEHAGGQTS